MQYIQCTADFMQRHKTEFANLLIQLLSVDFNNPNNISFIQLNQNNLLNKIINYVENCKGVVIAAFNGERVCGYVHGYVRDFLDEKRTMLDGIIVDPEYQGQKIGRQLEIELAKYARENGCDKMELFVTVNNSRAIEFYKKNGYIDSRYHLIKNL